MTNPFVAPDLAAPTLSHIVSTPLGRLLLTGDGHALTGLYMIDADRHMSPAPGRADAEPVRLRRGRGAARGVLRR
jgi:hypothetical protein